MTYAERLFKIVERISPYIIIALILMSFGCVWYAMQEAEHIPERVQTLSDMPTDYQRKFKAARGERCPFNLEVNALPAISR